MIGNGTAPVAGKKMDIGQIEPYSIVAKCKLAALRAAYHRHKNKSLSPHRNKSKRDISRFDCLHRTSCLSKYDEYDVLPCKKCIKYIPGGFDVELAKQDKIGMTID